MFKPKTYSELCNAMQMSAVVEIAGLCGVIESISRDKDESGRCFSVEIKPTRGITEHRIVVVE